MTELPIAIYGAGGFAREVGWLVSQSSDETVGRRLVAYIDDDEKAHGKELHGVRVLSLEEVARAYPGAGFAIGVGAPAVRRQLVSRAKAAGLVPVTLVHPRAEMSTSVRLGEGVVICAGNILTVDISVGDYVQINLDCTVGHDVVLEEFATLAPGVHLSGWVHVGRDAYLGTGAAVINGRHDRPLNIGAGAVVGAGACVVRDVPAAATVVGVPARPK
jgi:sugar O-acyltransferase (sialic acid O-acetyltransferase NeuD family)